MSKRKRIQRAMRREFRRSGLRYETGETGLPTPLVACVLVLIVGLVVWAWGSL